MGTGAVDSHSPVNGRARASGEASPDHARRALSRAGERDCCSGGARGRRTERHDPPGRTERVLWLYAADHRDRPFFVLGARTLSSLGVHVRVLDSASGKARNADYDHLPPSRAVASLAPPGALRGLIIQCSLGGSAVRSLAWRPTTIVFSLPHDGALAWALARVLRARLVYYPFDVFGEQQERVRPFSLRLERWLLRRIDALITQNLERARIYREERGARAQASVVHNYKPARASAQPGALRAALGVPPSCRIVLYEGLLRNGRHLDRLALAAKFLPDDCLLVLMGHRTDWWRRELEPQIRAAGLADRIRVVPSVPHDELPSYVADADAGVIIYDDRFRNNLYCEPGKLSDYVRAGVPVVVPAFPTLAPTVAAYRIGVAFRESHPESIAAAISSVLSADRASWREGLARAQRDLVWETQAPTFLEAVLGTSWEEAQDSPARPKTRAGAPLEGER